MKLAVYLIKKNSNKPLCLKKREKIISQQLGKSNHIIIKYTKEGSPYLFDSQEGEPIDMSLSISHKGCYELIAIASRKIRLGCDIEHHGKKRSFDEISKIIFPCFSSQLSKVVDERQKRHLFYFYWLLYEAYFKAYGMEAWEAFADKSKTHNFEVYDFEVHDFEIKEGMHNYASFCYYYQKYLDYSFLILLDITDEAIEFLYFQVHENHIT